MKRLGINKCLINFLVDDFNMIDNEREMTKKVEKLNGRNKRRSGAKTKEGTSHAIVVAPSPSPFSQK